MPVKNIFVCLIQTDGVGLRRIIRRSALTIERAPIIVHKPYNETPADVATWLKNVLQANEILPVDDFSNYANTFVADVTDNLSTFIADYDPQGGKNQVKVYLRENTDTQFVGVGSVARIIQFSNGESVGIGDVYLDSAIVLELNNSWSGVNSEGDVVAGETFTMPNGQKPGIIAGTLANTTWASSVTVDGVELFPGERKAFDFAYDIPEGSEGTDLVFTAHATNLAGEDSVSVTFAITAPAPPPPPPPPIPD